MEEDLFFNDIKDGVVFFNPNKELLGVSKRGNSFQVRRVVGKQRIVLGVFNSVSSANSFFLSSSKSIESLNLNKPLIKNERWVEIPDTNSKYYASTEGRILSVNKNRVKLLKPSVSKCGYAFVKICKGNTSIPRSVHLLVVSAFKGHYSNKTHELVVDHINSDKLDNRLNNLEVVSQRENVKRAKGGFFKKYSKNSRSNKYFSRISIEGKSVYLGNFSTPEDAIKAYDRAYEELVTNKNQII
jgi:hypothetical protein